MSASSSGRSAANSGTRKRVLEVGGRHHVEQAIGQAEPEPRPVLDDAARHAGEAALHRFDGVLRREELLDVGFAEIERHGAG